MTTRDWRCETCPMMTFIEERERGIKEGKGQRGGKTIWREGSLDEERRVLEHGVEKSWRGVDGC